MNPENTYILPPPDWAVELLSASPRNIATIPTCSSSSAGPGCVVWFKANTTNGPLFGTICLPAADRCCSLADSADLVESLIVRSLGQLDGKGDESTTPKVDLEKVERIATGAPATAVAPPAETPASDAPPAAPARRGRPKKAQPAPTPAEAPPETPAAAEPEKVFVPDGMTLQKIGASPDPIAPPTPPASVPVPATAADPSVPKTGVDYGETIVCYGNRKGAKLSSVPRNIIEWYANEMLRKIALKDGRKPTAEEANLANSAAMYLEGGH